MPDLRESQEREKQLFRKEMMRLGGHLTNGTQGGGDDFAADIRFGEWLRVQRVRAGLALEVSAKRAELSVRRLKCLELGLSGRGITRLEAARLAAVYGVSAIELSDRAARP